MTKDKKKEAGEKEGKWGGRKRAGSRERMGKQTGQDRNEKKRGEGGVSKMFRQKGNPIVYRGEKERGKTGGLMRFKKKGDPEGQGEEGLQSL